MPISCGHWGIGRRFAFGGRNGGGWDIESVERVHSQVYASGVTQAITIRDHRKGRVWPLPAPRREGPKGGSVESAARRRGIFSCFPLPIAYCRLPSALKTPLRPRRRGHLPAGRREEQGGGRGEGNGTAQSVQASRSVLGEGGRLVMEPSWLIEQPIGS